MQLLCECVLYAGFTDLQGMSACRACVLLKSLLRRSQRALLSTMQGSRKNGTLSHGPRREKLMVQSSRENETLSHDPHRDFMAKNWVTSPGLRTDKTGSSLLRPMTLSYVKISILVGRAQLG